MDIQTIYSNLKTQSSKSLEYVLHELQQIRTGQMTPALVENLEVKAYGGASVMRLQQLASIATEGPTTLVISPFDPSVIQDIERAINASPLGMSPRVDGKVVRITASPLNEEQRMKFAKMASEKVEDGKVKMRLHRDEARKDLKKIFDEKLISEDDKFRAEKEIDTMTKESTDRLDEIKERKQAEIMSV